MANKVATIIAEGITEKAFLISLITNRLGFVPCTGKNCICFQNPRDPTVFWIFPVPALGITHTGGYSKLKTKEPYQKAKAVFNNHSYVFGSADGIISHTYVLTDTDRRSPKLLNQLKVQIIAAAVKSGFDEEMLEIHTPHEEIETWLISGLPNDFDRFCEDQNVVDSVLNSASEDIVDPKSVLNKILEPSLKGANRSIADTIGAVFDYETAVTKSESFREFWTSLKDKELI